MRIILFAFFLGLNICATGQIITTIAGNGTKSYCGDGGQAVSACLNEPHAVDIDGDGNIYVCDQQNYRIRKITPEGIITTIAGIGISGFSGDSSLAVNAQIGKLFAVKYHKGNIYLTDDVNHRIRMIDSAGIITTIAGTGVAGFSGDSGLAINANLNQPAGMAFDALYNIYFADCHNHRVRKIHVLTGIVTTVAGTGTPAYSGDSGVATMAELWFPNYLSMDGNDNLYITDNQNHRIRKINTSAIISTVAGNGIGTFSGDGGLASAASINYPGGTVMDASGNLFIADHINNRIRRVDTAGVITTYAGTGSSGFSGDGGLAVAADLDWVVDLALDNNDNLLLADFRNHRIRKIVNPLGVKNIASAGDLIIYPNPSKGIVHLSTPEAGVVMISDQQGRLVKQVTLREGEILVSLPEVATGIYLATFIADKDGRKTTQRILLER